MPIDWLGSAMAMASLVTSVSRPSSGAMRMLTAKPALTPAYAAASPASGWRPTVRNAAAASGIRIR